MLAALSIRDIVLIDRLDLVFPPGLNVLTGETGAGKSILLDALALALGARGDGGLVRHGAGQGQVTAVFDVPPTHPAFALLDENGVAGNGDIILRRIQAPDGRSRAFINDQPVSITLQRSVGAALVEIHGQHADRALVDPASHRALLDAYGGLGGRCREVAQLYAAWRSARREVEAGRERVARAAADAEYLRHVLDEITRLAPEEGEEVLLADRRAAMMAAEKIAGELSQAAEMISGSASPVPGLSALLRRLERKAPGAQALIEPVIDPLSRALDALEEARSAVEASQRAAAFDPRELERIEERLFALRAAARKHGVPVGELPSLRQGFAERLSEIEAGEERLARSEDAEAAARRSYEIAAFDLSRARRDAAATLAAAVNSELPPLRLERARFEVQFEAGAIDSGGPEGIDRIEFWVETNPGTRPGPLMKVASGGELARFLLALKVVLADRGSAPTLVFDEVDTGVGGAVADAIGQRLARLATGVQVLAVTHAPQVAARASTHYLISKEGGDEGVASRVRRLERSERREEIARMLAGARITDAARAAADQLMAAGI